jgi:hypothetical protein
MNGFAAENHDNTCKTSERNRDLRRRTESFTWFHRTYVKQGAMPW